MIIILNMSINKPYEYDNPLQKTTAGRVKLKNEAKSKNTNKNTNKNRKKI